MIEEKTCSKCGEIKPIGEFYLNTEGNPQNPCKACRKIQAGEWKSSNYERYRETNRIWYQKNRDRNLRTQKEWKEKNADHHRTQSAKYYHEHKAEYNETRKVRRKRSAMSPQQRLCMSMATAIRLSLVSGKQGRHWENMVGYTVHDLIKHLEVKFKPGMNWSNYGEWHIDHIIPIRVFCFNTPNDPDFNRCWSLKNLQPLWAKENIRKSGKVDRPFQPCLPTGEAL